MGRRRWSRPLCGKKLCSLGRGRQGHAPAHVAEHKTVDKRRSGPRCWSCIGWWSWFQQIGVPCLGRIAFRWAAHCDCTESRYRSPTVGYSYGNAATYGHQRPVSPRLRWYSRNNARITDGDADVFCAAVSGVASRHRRSDSASKSRSSRCAAAKRTPRTNSF